MQVGSGRATRELQNAQSVLVRGHGAASQGLHCPGTARNGSPAGSACLGPPVSSAGSSTQHLGAGILLKLDVVQQKYRGSGTDPYHVTYIPCGSNIASVEPMLKAKDNSACSFSSPKRLVVFSKGEADLNSCI